MSAARAIGNQGKSDKLTNIIKMNEKEYDSVIDIIIILNEMLLKLVLEKTTSTEIRTMSIETTVKGRHQE